MLNKLLLSIIVCAPLLAMSNEGDSFLSTSNNGNYQVDVKTGQTVSVGSFINFDITISCLNHSDTCLVDSVNFSASMPHHGHGMKYFPKISQKTKTKYKVEGVRVHMDGYWEFYIDIEKNGQIERAQFSINV